MKKTILHLFLMMMAVTAFAQDQKMAKDRYTISGGLLGAMNFSKLIMDGQNPGNISYDPRMGWAAGGWVNFPLGSVVSIEPQVLYSFQSYKGYNPDFNTGVDETFNPNRNQVLNPGYDFGSYPKPRTILLGVQLTF